jgi:hypothetical protein
MNDRRAALLVAFVAIVCALVARSTVFADSGSIHLGAGDCYGAGSSTAAISNACLTNTGSFTLVASVTPPTRLQRFCGFESMIYIYTSGTTLSPWWHMESSPSRGCRAGKISVSDDFTNAATTCEDYFAGRGMAAMDYGINKDGMGPNTARIWVIGALPDTMATSISPPAEYYVYSVTIQRAQSTGGGDCAGCLDRACFALSYITLGQPAPLNEYTLTQGVQQVVTYNGGTGGGNCAAGQTTKSTWGAIKATFR